MIRNDKSRFLLYIEPKEEEKHESIDDELTKLITMAFSKSTPGSSNYYNLNAEEYFAPGSGFKGVHHTDCATTSSNKDYLLENGMIVNSLCIFYVQYYRNSISENDWDKLIQLGNYYNIIIKK